MLNDIFRSVTIALTLSRLIWKSLVTGLGLVHAVIIVYIISSRLFSLRTASLFKTNYPALKFDPCVCGPWHSFDLQLVVYSPVYKYRRANTGPA